jgi:hypothetical protein
VRAGIEGLPGHEDIRHFMREVEEAFDAVQLECLEIHDLGERRV